MSGFQIRFHLDKPEWKARRDVGVRCVVWLPNLLPPGRAKVESDNRPRGHCGFWVMTALRSVATEIRD